MKNLKKYFALFACMFLVTHMAVSQQVTRNEAINAAVSALHIKGDKNTSFSDMDSVFVMNKNNHTLLYEVRFKNGETVLLSGNKACLPILGYYKVTKRNAPILSQKDAIPEGLQDILRDYAHQNEECFKTREPMASHAYWDTLLLFNPERNNRAMLSTIVLPMLTTHWGQNESNDTDPQYVAYYTYNYYAPQGVNCTRCAAGCSAVAMAQIVKYWTYPQGVPEWCYTTDYAWNNMPDAIIYKNNNNFSVQRDAVATLIADCGTAMNMNYCSNSNCSSSTYWIDQITDAFHRFGYNDAYDYKESQCANHTEWVNKVALDMFNGYPVFYTAKGYDGTDSIGHAFVCHGYVTLNNITKYFYINWGWNGLYDGAFTLENLNPSSTYNLHHEAVFNIYPSYFWSNIYMECNQTFYSGTNKAFVTQGVFSNSGYNYIINSGAEVEINGASINLTNGFHAAEGSVFRAKIAPCSNSSNYLTGEDEILAQNQTAQDSIPTTKSLQQLAETPSGVSVYPNPVTGTLHIALFNPEETVKQVVVTNLLGNIVLQQDNLPDGTINTTPLANGMYIARICTIDGKTYHAKFVKK